MLKPIYAAAYYTKRTKKDVKHVLNLTKKWVDMAKLVNDDVLFWKLPDWTCGCKRIILS